MILKWRKIIFSVSHFFWFILKKNDTTTLCKTSNFNISTFSSFLSTRNSIAEIMPIHHKTENNQSIKHSSIAIALINLNFGLFFLQLENSPCLTPSTCENGMNKYRDTEYLITLPIWCMVDGWLQIGCFEACYCFDGKCRYSHIDVKAFKKLHPFIWYYSPFNNMIKRGNFQWNNFLNRIFNTWYLPPIGNLIDVILQLESNTKK